jgi:hypothetical protein
MRQLNEDLKNGFEKLKQRRRIVRNCKEMWGEKGKEKGKIVRKAARYESRMKE